MRYRLGIDIGGTFTDFVLVDEQENKVFLEKRLTTHDNYLDAILNGTEKLLNSIGVRANELDSVVHGTTLVTNTVIERRGALTALATTKGSRDVIEIGSELRYDVYDLSIERPKPLVPRNLRFEIDERVKADGSVLVPVDTSQVALIAEAMKAAGIQSVAVCLLHSYANPAHERLVGETLARLLPGVEITLSSELVPEIREFERSSTSVMNAYVQPLTSSYLKRMERELRSRSITCPLHLMLSNGGLTSVENSVAAPINLIESGPAGGAIAASFFGANAGEKNLISFDMGGTTAKICLINDGKPTRSHEFEAGRIHRFKKGSGLPLRVSVIEMIEIGAGGGSIAHIDNMGLLKIGPESAGSYPGPACYGRGGTRPVVTDADVVLGYLNPDFFLGGSMKLDVEKSRQAIMEHVGKPLSLDVVTAAASIQEIVNESMATATRLYVSERGRDLRHFTLLAFGGAGPVHAYRVAEILGIKRLICPYAAGNASALGFLLAPLTVEPVRSYVTALDRLNWTHLRELYAAMEDEARTALNRLGVRGEEIEFSRMAEMRFAGQGYEVQVPIPLGQLDEEKSDEIKRNFFVAYKQLFERAPEGVPIEALTWRLIATGKRPQLKLEFQGDVVNAGLPKKGTRPVYFQRLKRYVDTPVYDRYRLTSGAELVGPAVVEERESTVVIGPDSRVHVDNSLNLVIDLP